MFSKFIAILCSFGVMAIPVDLEIKNLPGWDKPLPSRQYSGFVNASFDGTMQIHFWFVEAESDPENSPLILWFNGGPGASSLYGLLVELGPFRLSDLSYQGEEYKKTGIPQLIYNPSGWQKTGNILALSIPPPVGFSYCFPAGPSAQGDDCGSWNDQTTADVTYYALKSWLSLFSEYKSNEMYLTGQSLEQSSPCILCAFITYCNPGESYAGVYVPMLAQQILDHPEENINLKGIAVGDACTPPDVCGEKHGGPFYYIEFLYGKSAFSTTLYHHIHNVCSKEELITGKSVSDKCNEAIKQIPTEVGGYWSYAYYDDCWYENDIRRFLQIAQTESNSSPISVEVGRNPNNVFKYYGPPINKNGLNRQSKQFSVGNSNESKLPYTEVPNGYMCGGPSAQQEWLSLDVVKEAIHVPLDAVFFQCDNGEGFTYNISSPDLIAWYRDVISANKLKVLVYNGDTDPCITAYQAETWTRSLGFKEIQSWRPWTTDGCQRMGGAVVRYTHKFDFLTVRGSGHMVPQFKPEASLEFLTRFINNEDYKIYDASCNNPT